MEEPEESPISMLRKQLYAKEESVELQQRQRDLAAPAPTKRRPLAPAARPALIDVVAQRSRQRRKLLRIAALIGVFTLVVVGAASATLWYRHTQQVVPSQEHLAISVPAEVIAGQTGAYTIDYRNDSHVTWERVEIVVDLPVGLRVASIEPAMEHTGKQQTTLRLGSLAAGQSGQIHISGQLIGEQGSSVLTRATMSLTPENFPSGRFDTSQTATTRIASVPLEISIEATNNASDGERVPVVIHVRNNGSEALNGGKLNLEVASGIHLATEDDAFSPGFSAVSNAWDLPALQPLEEATRTAVLFLDGSPSERRMLTVRGIVSEAGNDFVLRSVDQVFTISASELALSQTFNDSADDLLIHAGDTVKAKVIYKNTGTIALSNAVLTVSFQGLGLDPSKIKLDSGSYNPTTQTITWRASSVPGLATIQPQQSGEIPYEFSLLPIEQFPKDDSAKNKNFVVTAVIDSPNLPVTAGQQRAISDRRVLPFVTNLMLATDAFYDDGRLGISSTGPLPPQVGQTTTYTVRFRLGSTLNDAGDVKMTAVLPDGVSYTGKTYKTVGEVEFNDRTNEITWTIPLIDGLAGRTKPGPELDVQVAITPGENLRGNSVRLLQSAQAHATDQFADQAVEATLNDQGLPTTETAVPDKGKVE